MPRKKAQTQQTNNIVTDEILRTISPNSRPNIREAIVLHLTDLAPKYGLSSKLSIAHFLGQTAAESGGYTVVIENMNYSADALRRVFPRHFRVVDANKFHRKPEMIANHVYANRMGNGNYASGDGWRFRGHGLIQLTGRSNFTRFGSDIGMSAEEAVEYAKTPKGMIEASLWFWKTNNLNRWAEADDILRLSRAINVGNPNSTVTPHGMTDRTNYTNRAKKALGV